MYAARGLKRCGCCAWGCGHYCYVEKLSPQRALLSSEALVVRLLIARGCSALLQRSTLNMGVDRITTPSLLLIA